MSLKEIFNNNPNIIINTDIDGFLCGMILQEYFRCKIVGFSNSRETVWVDPEVQNMDDSVYVVLYVARPNVFCIDEHVIAYNHIHFAEIQSYGTKINPNLDRERTFVGDMQSDYYHKYPFGTIHYLISLMEKEGIKVSIPDLYKKWTIEPFDENYDKITTCAGQVILRADDALYSTLSLYRENALDWWNWLDPRNEYTSIQSFIDYINSCDIYQAKQYKEGIGSFFKALGCDGIDGAFKTVTDAKGLLLEKVKYYSKVIGDIVGIELILPEVYRIHKGEYAVQYCKPGYNMELFYSKNLYSYAFIFGPHPRYPNLSFTMDMI